MSLKDDMQLFSTLALFAGLNGEQLRLLAFGAERQFVARGQVLFPAGAHIEGAYIVSSGRLALSTPSRSGQTQMGEAGPSTLLCELALVTDIECTMTAAAVEDSEVICISRSIFRRLLEEFPEVALHVESRIRANLQALAKDAAQLAGRFS